MGRLLLLRHIQRGACFCAQHHRTEEPLSSILQTEYIPEDEPGQYAHVNEARLTEWPVKFLQRPRRTPATIPNFPRRMRHPIVLIFCADSPIEVCFELLTSNNRLERSRVASSLGQGGDR